MSAHPVMDRESPDILRDGWWQQHGHVLRWVEAPEQLIDPMRITTLIACPTCRARVGQTCRTRSGHTTTPHGSRLAPRLCLCGARLRWKRRYCDECRDKALQDAKNDWGRRARSAA